MKAIKIIGLFLYHTFKISFKIMWFFIKTIFYILFFVLLVITMCDGGDDVGDILD